MQKHEFTFENGEKIALLPPTVDEYYRIFFAVDTAEKVGAITEWLVRSCERSKLYIKPSDILHAELIFILWLRNEKKNPIYKAPYYKVEPKEKVYFNTVYHEMKWVSDYTGMSFAEIRKIDIFTFWRYYRDSIIFSLNQGENGREYLKNAYNSQQTKADMEALKEYMEE